jgi:hypothetical protein
MKDIKNRQIFILDFPKKTKIVCKIPDFHKFFAIWLNTFNNQQVFIGFNPFS